MATKQSVGDARVLITGGARGIGAATAKLLTARGARVWIGDVDEDACLQTAAELGVCGGRLDVTSAASWQDMLARIEASDGPLDILVNNAGVMPLGAFEAETEQVRDLILDVNIRGVLNGMQAVLPGMARRGHGHVVNVASMAGMIPVPGMVTYNASKFAALGASLSARREYAGTGVAVSAVLPSAVRTELTSGAPLGGGMPTVDPEDVAAAILAVLRTRAARRSVPRWVAPAWSTTAFVPEWLQSLARRLVDDRRALTSIDAAARSAYTERVDRQARAHRGEAAP
ncbi:SDR family NAD(P)-dependent oxidoreductase [Mycolicibacter virginiensis]|uniref:SDR family NAD(P)-dependent oxidoreductase n=1 Tax=Mycolicibacter virginiensis TaxID=1795032 RepID=A0A9X7NYJ3_9MYCO|nr:MULTISPECIES: SDR family oxidoreductase [Mycobacteriaceae]PQM52091.1 SDR family NAD(P)-dependent oxidoreductase [Mycolicibacter virginiensis]